MSLNKVILIGRLGRDPETRYMPNGDAVCNFSIATSESWKDQSGQKKERTEWHNITMYRKLAEIAAQYLKKGSQVYIEGRIQSRKYTGKDGIERTAFEIIASEMKMLGGKADGGEGQHTPAPQPVPQPVKRQAPPQAVPQDDIDDDVPF
ncbi:single-stranded DNA-binding protein [Eikenella sp. NML120348]|uniref:single-stranded DNA-binding protein n=1 Tax=Eikenella sp. NML120348 TaxID=1795831 RepID=UPI0007E1B979|nr:single-stranded DNA-binding protein [Eikenella sp. NML120348]OAM37800.1 single-stranded DNA-binding protein [Eikenella sp. NML120348]